MTPLAFYPAFVATLISVASLSRIAHGSHDISQPRTLSELAAAEESLLKRFRTILWLCGSLFAVSMYWFVVPRIDHPVWVAMAQALQYVGNFTLAIVPARGKSLVWHGIFAQIMAVGMLASTYLFWLSLDGGHATVELVIALAMSAFGLLTIADKRRFIFYELSFIFLSHVSILVAILALR